MRFFLGSIVCFFMDHYKAPDGYKSWYCPRCGRHGHRR